MGTEHVGRTWYVYLLCDPDTRQPFYVGKGTGDRMFQHERTGITNAKNRSIITQLHLQGKKVLTKKIAEFRLEMDAYIYEWAMINLYHTQVTNTRDTVPVIKRSKEDKQMDIQIPDDDSMEEMFPLLTIEQAAHYLNANGNFAQTITSEFVEKQINSGALAYVRLRKDMIRISPAQIKRDLLRT